MYELTIDWPPMAAAEAAELVKPATSVFERHGFTAGECFLEMVLRDIGQPFDRARASAWMEAEQALATAGWHGVMLGIAERAHPRACPDCQSRSRL